VFRPILGFPNVFEMPWAAPRKPRKTIQMKAPRCDQDFSVMVPVFEPSHDPASGKPEIQCHRCVKPRCKRAFNTDQGYFDWATPWPPREQPRFVCRKHKAVMMLTRAEVAVLRFQCPVAGCGERASCPRKDSTELRTRTSHYRFRRA
jgi:hypothetical protein